MQREKRSISDVTMIRWNYSIGSFQCVRCGSLMQYQFDYMRCPYCKRFVIKNDKRGIEYT